MESFSFFSLPPFLSAHISLPLPFPAGMAKLGQPRPPCRSRLPPSLSLSPVCTHMGHEARPSSATIVLTYAMRKHLPHLGTTCGAHLAISLMAIGPSPTFGRARTRARLGRTPSWARLSCFDPPAKAPIEAVTHATPPRNPSPSPPSPRPYPPLSCLS